MNRPLSLDSLEFAELIENSAVSIEFIASSIQMVLISDIIYTSVVTFLSVKEPFRLV